MILWKIHQKNISDWLQGEKYAWKYAYYVTCEEFVKDEKGDVVEVICTYDPATKGGDSRMEEK